MQLEKKGVLKECQTELLGTGSESIRQAEDRELFKELCEKLGEPVLPVPCRQYSRRSPSGGKDHRLSGSSGVRLLLWAERGGEGCRR